MQDEALVTVGNVEVEGVTEPEDIHFTLAARVESLHQKLNSIHQMVQAMHGAPKPPGAFPTREEIAHNMVSPDYQVYRQLVIDYIKQICAGVVEKGYPFPELLDVLVLAPGGSAGQQKRERCALFRELVATYKCAFSKHISHKQQLYGDYYRANVPLRIIGTQADLDDPSSGFWFVHQERSNEVKFHLHWK